MRNRIVSTARPSSRSRRRNTRASARAPTRRGASGSPGSSIAARGTTTVVDVRDAVGKPHRATLDRAFDYEGNFWARHGAHFRLVDAEVGYVDLGRLTRDEIDPMFAQLAGARALQQVGIVPDVVVRPTLRGLRAGKDEVLDRALAYVATGK
jgi:hypothetical protein